MSNTKITVANNGPLRIAGEIEIVDVNGNIFGLGGREMISLCRCGLSANKPFCDGAHKDKFQSECTSFDLPPKKV